MDDEPQRCCFDEWASANAKRARKKGLAAGITKHLMTALDEAGLKGRTVLDVGCGTGDLALAALASGAARASGMDLGPGAIESARALARERGLDERTTFEIGDASTAELPGADVVVLNRVVCCYRDARGLLANTLEVAGDVYALTMPVDTGAIGAFNRVFTWLGNRWFALRKRKFGSYRTYVHPVAKVDERVRAAGFEPLVRGRRALVWDLAVYTRPNGDRAATS